MQVYSYKNNNIVKEKSLINALDIDLNKDKVITVVGAGGKTSTIFELGNELSNLNKKTIITTSAIPLHSNSLCAIMCYQIFLP